VCALPVSTALLSLSTAALSATPTDGNGEASASMGSAVAFLRNPRTMVLVISVVVRCA
jgi:hypothetical protein